MNTDGSDMMGIATCSTQVKDVALQMLDNSVSHIKFLYVLLLDGTVCEHGWLGYGGNCYMFHTGDGRGFTDA